MNFPKAQVHSRLPRILEAKSVKSPDVGRFVLAIEGDRAPALITTMRTSPTTGLLHPAVVPQRADPWTTIVSNLLEGHGCKTLGRRLGTSGARPYYTGKKVRQRVSVREERGQNSLKKNVHISFVERFGAKTVSLTWRDSTEACYAEQPWMLKIARSPGRCALTGLVVNRGDMVYSPASRAANRPLNCTQMILLTALENLEGLESPDHGQTTFAETDVSQPPD